MKPLLSGDVNNFRDRVRNYPLLAALAFADNHGLADLNVAQDAALSSGCGVAPPNGITKYDFVGAPCLRTKSLASRSRGTYETAS